MNLATLILSTNMIYLDPLGQFEVLNNLNSGIMTSVLNLISNAFESIENIESFGGAHILLDFFTGHNSNSINDFSDLFQDYFKAQIILCKMNVCLGLQLLPFFLLAPNIIHPNLVVDGYTDNVNIIISTYGLPVPLTKFLYLVYYESSLLKFFSFFKSVFDYQTREPIHLALQNNLTFQDYFINYFIQELYISQFLLTSQESTLRTLNLFSILSNQHITQEPYTALLNAVLNPHNASLFYEYTEFLPSMYKAISAQEFSIFTKLFGCSISDINNIIFQNTAANKNTDLTKQELALYIGFRIVLDYFHEMELGMDRLCRNFISVYKWKHADLSKFDTGADLICTPCGSNDTTAANSCSIDNNREVDQNAERNLIDYLHLRLYTRYHTEFLPNMLKYNYPAVNVVSNDIIFAIEALASGDSKKIATYLEALSQGVDKATRWHLHQVAFNCSLSDSTKFAQAVYQVDKILTLQTHNYDRVGVLNPDLLPNENAYVTVALKQHYDLWCYFQHKAHGAAVLESPAVINKLQYYIRMSENMSPLDTALTFNVQQAAKNFAILACCDLALDDEVGMFIVDKKPLLKLQEHFLKSPQASYLITLAFEQCLRLLEPAYVNAASPKEVSKQYTIDLLTQFMTYFIRGVLLNPTPEQFFALPYYDAENPLSTMYNPIIHNLVYGPVLDAAVRPLLNALNTHLVAIGETPLSTTNDVITYLTKFEQTATLPIFASTHGITVVFELFNCMKNIWDIAQKSSEFKLNTWFAPVSIITYEPITTKANQYFETYIHRFLADTDKLIDVERNLVGPFSLFAIILQQLPFLGVTAEQVDLIRKNYNNDISKYEHLFNLNSDKYTKKFNTDFIKTRFESIIGTDAVQSDTHSKMSIDIDKFTSKNTFNANNYLSGALNNLYFFNTADTSNFKQKLYFEISIISGLLFNNQSVFIAFVVLVISVLFFILPLISNIKLIPLNWQYVMETIYKFILNILNAQVGKVAAPFFPYVFSVFSIILIANIAGMTLYAFTLTSHILVTFTLGVSSFLGLTILGFYVQNLAFLNLFLPKGIPTALIPILLVVEVISYVSRALSLSIRLFANLMSGHTLLHILAFFSSKLFKFKYIIGLLSFLLILAIVVLEFCIAMLQAYVFAILICIYLNDSFHGGH